VKTFKLANAALNNLTLSSNMQSVDFMLAMARTVKDIDLDHVTFVQYPAADHPYQAGRLTPRDDLAQEIFDGLKAGKQLKPTGLGEGVQVDGVDKTTLQPDAAAQDPAVQDPAVQDPAVQDPAAPSTTTTPDPAASDVVELPSDITGVQANQSACSLGRTVN
jgi:cell division septation protein DedD